MSAVTPEPEWTKCLVCKTSEPMHSGFTFQEMIAERGNKCPYCGEVGLIRDKKAEARARTKAEESEAERARVAELDEFMYPVPAHVFSEGPGCPNCGSREGVMGYSSSFGSLKWSHSPMVRCHCSHIYTWPCIDIRTPDQPGEDKPLSPRDEEVRLRRRKDDQLGEVFG